MSALSRHIVFATTGSLGDLHPFLAVGSELQRRGHRVTLATSAVHAPHVRAAGLAFRHMRPDPENTPAFHAQYMHPKTGGQFVYQHYLGPAIRQSYADLTEATQDADMLVSQSLMALAAPLVAAKSGIPWISAVLQPMSFFSLHDRPNYLPLPFLSWLCGRYPQVHEQVFHYVRKHTENWIRPVTQLRREIGVSQAQHPMYEGQHSSRCVLAMFSPLLGNARPDWPVSVIQTGTTLYAPGSAALPDDLAHFLAYQSRPLAIFTLSSAASNDAGDFYNESLAAAGALGLRALLITGGLAASHAPASLPAWARRIDYAAFEDVFPHASVIVHSGGVATSFKALCAGKPQVIVPHAHDQLDNAMRLCRLGSARMIGSRKATRTALRRAMRAALNDAGMHKIATALGRSARQEDGVGMAADAIERELQHA